MRAGTASREFVRTGTASREFPGIGVFPVGSTGTRLPPARGTCPGRAAELPSSYRPTSHRETAALYLMFVGDNTAE